MERESEIPKCLFSSVESTQAPTFSGCAWAGLARTFLWTDLHGQCLQPWRQESWGGSGESRAPASLLLHRLKLTSCVYTAATVMSSLCLLLPRARPYSAVTLCILPHGQVCFRLLEKSVGLEL